MKPRHRTDVASEQGFRKNFIAPLTGQALSVTFGLLFLFQCMILPLVGKAAVYGSNSPGAGPADTLWKNHLFFTVMLLITLTVGAAAWTSKWMRRKEDQGPYPNVTAGLLGLTLLLAAVYAFGWLKL
ncbi:MAG: hypothetical protein LBN38_03165 [Verrucomicrobiota bacterium]|nr:hypothetical protein [Verrucomicrobiota bacterium]